MQTHKFLDFRPARIRRRAKVMFYGSVALLVLLLGVCWFTTSAFVESRYTEQLRNHLEVLSSTIDQWHRSEGQNDNARRPEPNVPRSEEDYHPCPSPAAMALCNMIREAHYEYESRASPPWLSAGPLVTGYFFLFNDNLDGIVHGAEPAKYEHSSTEIKKKYPENFDSIAKLQEEALKDSHQIHCINYDWKPISKDEKESKLGCVKQIKTDLIPTRDFLFLGTGMLRSEIRSHTIGIFSIAAALMAVIYGILLLLFRFYRRDMTAIQWGILGNLAAGLVITRKNETGDREKILAVNRELNHLYGIHETGTPGTKGLENKGLERLIPTEHEKNRRHDPDLESQRTSLDYTFMLERTGTKLLLRDVAVPLWSEDGREMLHTILDRKHTDTYEGFLAQYKKYLPPLLFETKVAQQVRVATVLVCELPGIIKLYEEKGISADECAKDLNHYVRVMLRLAHDKGGIVDKVIGDRIVIHFGMGSSAGEKDDTRRCLEAAMAIKAEIQPLLDKQQQQQRPVALLRMGIASGRLAASELGTPDRADVIVHGEAMVLAQELCSACPAGKILVNERTKVNGSNFNFQDHELPKEFTWKDTPIRAFRLTSTIVMAAVSTKAAS